MRERPQQFEGLVSSTAGLPKRGIECKSRLAAAETPPAEQDPETLKAIYERLCQERDRLRDARGFFARGLGPAPASAGIATGVVAALSEGPNHVVLWFAVGVLCAMVMLSTWYGAKAPYRHLYARTVPEAVRASAAQKPEDSLEVTEWYRKMIRLERDLYGSLRTENRYLPPWKRAENLQEGADLERTGALLVQGLWVIVILLLVLATIV